MLLSALGDVDVRICRLRACGCRVGTPELKSIAPILVADDVARELACVTAEFAERAVRVWRRAGLRARAEREARYAALMPTRARYRSSIGISSAPMTAPT